MELIKKIFIPCVALMSIFFFSGCSSKDKCNDEDTNSYSDYSPPPNFPHFGITMLIDNIKGIKTLDTYPIKVVFEPLDAKKEKGKSFLRYNTYKKFCPETRAKMNPPTIRVYLYPYGSNDKIIGQERKFNFELQVAGEKVLQKTITIKSEPNREKKVWEQLKVEKLDVENKDYITKIDGKRRIYIDLNKK